MFQLLILLSFFVGGLVLHTTGAMLDSIQREKSNLRSTLSFLETLESSEPDEGNSCLLERPANCAEILLQGHTKSRVYTVYPRPWYKQSPFQVYCDMDTDGGGWTVFQKRGDYEVQENFYRGWDDYKKGFGSLDRDFWLGNDHLYLLTHQDHVTMRVDLEDFEENKRYAHYQNFQVANVKDDFRLTIGGYTGDVGDNLIGMNNIIFVTKDRNDVNNCSKMFKGGWWYTNCHGANLNGLYLRGNHSTYADGIEWGAWRGHHYSLKTAEMKVRPTNFLDCDGK